MKLLGFIFFWICFIKSEGQLNNKLKTDTVLNTDDYSIIKKNAINSPTGTSVIWKKTGEVIYQGKKDSLPFSILAIYNELSTRADGFFKEKKYSSAVSLYHAAFTINNDLGKVKHRYNAACCYSMLDNTAAAFTELFKLAKKGKYYNYLEISTEDRFDRLQSDSQWKELLSIVRENAETMKEKLNSEIGNH